MELCRVCLVFAVWSWFVCGVLLEVSSDETAQKSSAYRDCVLLFGVCVSADSQWNHVVLRSSVRLGLYADSKRFRCGATVLFWVVLPVHVFRLYDPGVGVAGFVAGIEEFAKVWPQLASETGDCFFCLVCFYICAGDHFGGVAGVAKQSVRRLASVSCVLVDILAYFVGDHHRLRGSILLCDKQWADGHSECPIKKFQAKFD